VKQILSIYINKPVYWGFTALISLFCLAFVLPWLFNVSVLLSLAFGGMLLIDLAMLLGSQKTFLAKRFIPERLSNGDQNTIEIALENRYGFEVKVSLVDEIPFQFQKRDFQIDTTLESNTTQNLQYTLRPTERGEYLFGALNVFVSSPVGLLQRRFQFEKDKTVAVYPSFLQMREYELMAISNRLTDVGIKKIRRIGHTQEFEQIRSYVQGDDIRTINWQATARRNELMVNSYQDERAQSIYCLIDKGELCRVLLMDSRYWIMRLIRAWYCQISLYTSTTKQALLLFRIKLIKRFWPIENLGNFTAFWICCTTNKHFFRKATMRHCISMSKSKSSNEAC
jgi:uncharacterized protein (DUF58 family)